MWCERIWIYAMPITEYMRVCEKADLWFFGQWLDVAGERINLDLFRNNLTTTTTTTTTILSRDSLDDDALDGNEWIVDRSLEGHTYARGGRKRRRRKGRTLSFLAYSYVHTYGYGGCGTGTRMR